MADANLTAIQIAVQARIPVFLWGMPGTGKTKNTEAFSRILDERLWVVILSIREPSDQGGLPVIRPEGVTMEPPRWAKELVQAKHGIVFFDEFNTAPPTTQSSALRVIYGGWAGDEKLPEDTSFIAAGNPPETSTGAYDLTSAIANRWVHFNWKPEPAAWCDGMVAGWPDPHVTRLPRNWQDMIATKRGIFASFIRIRPDLLDAMPEDPAAQGRAWPSRRTWDMSAILTAAAAAAGHPEKSEVTRKLISGCVGDSAAREFTNWYVKLDLRNPEEYLANPQDTPLPRRQDQVMATLDAIASASLDRRHKKKDQIRRYEAAWVVIGRVARENKPDIVIPAARVLAPQMPDELDNKIPPEVDDIWEILDQAGIDFSQPPS